MNPESHLVTMARRTRPTARVALRHTPHSLQSIGTIKVVPPGKEATMP